MTNFVGEDVSTRDVVLFDFDGTLADTMAGILHTAHTVLERRGWSEERMGDLKRIIGPPFPQAWKQVFGVSEAEANQITAEYRAIYETLGPEGSPLYPGVLELLTELRRAGKRLGICSSKRHTLVERMLTAHGIINHFDVVVAQLDADHCEKPWLIAEALRRLGATAQDAVMVGDRNYDVLGAAEVDVPCVGVLFGTAERAELEEAGAAAIVSSMDELRAALLGR